MKGFASSPRHAGHGRTMRKNTGVLIMAALATVQMQSIWAMPMSQDDQRLTTAQPTPAPSLQQRNGQLPTFLNDFLSSIVVDRHQKNRNKVDGAVGIHPLPKRAQLDARQEDAALPQVTPVRAKDPADDDKTDDEDSQDTSKEDEDDSKDEDTSPSDEQDDASPSKDDPKPSGVASFFDPHSKLFPLAIAACVAAGLVVLLICVTIGKCCSHSQAKRDAANGKKLPGSKDDVTTTYNIGRSKTLGRSLRRALTGRKMGGQGGLSSGSFARRNREGSVLIDVGDEVFAVPVEVAQEYERERKSILSGSSGSSSGSRLTFPSNQPSPLRQALYNAQLIVAANQAESRVGTKAVPRGFDIQSWRAHSYAPDAISEDDEKTLSDEKDGLVRSMSQRIADGLRALRASRSNESLNKGIAAQDNVFSFDAEKQDHAHIRQAQVPLSAAVPVLTRGSGGWAIERKEERSGGESETSGSNYSRSSAAHVIRQSKAGLPPATSNTRDAALSQPRIAQRTVDAKPAVAQVKRQGDRYNGQRPKSILIKRSQEKLRQQQREATGAYRHRNPNAMQRSSSTPTGSPRTLQHRWSQENLHKKRSGALVAAVQPAKPDAGIVSNGRLGATNAATEQAGNTRELYRPLPLPPAISPMMSIASPKQ